MSFIKKHFTLSLLFACLLSLLGGFTELYSIKTRGIYAAMQTGNTITMFMNFIDGNIPWALDRMMVILMFFIGCLTAESLKATIKKVNKYYPQIVLSLMIICLIPSICIPVNIEAIQSNGTPTINDIVADCFMALYGAFQFCSFREMNKNVFSSTMMTTVMKNIAEFLVKSIKEKKIEYAFVSLEYFFILISFILGAMSFYLCYKFIDIQSKDTIIQLLPISMIAVLLILIGLSIFISKKDKEIKLIKE